MISPGLGIRTSRVLHLRRIAKTSGRHPGRFHSAVGTFPDAPSAAEIAPLLAKHSHHSPQNLTLSKLLSFGRPLTPISVLDSAQSVLSEAPRLFGWRVRNFEDLPFIVGMNPFIAKILAGYRKSFKALATYPPVKTLEDNADFAVQLQALVEAHANDIPTMAKGFQECSRYLSPEEISDFLDAVIRNRITVRLIAEQHVALTRALQDSSYNNKDYIGVVNPKCSPKDMIKMCGSFVADLCEATLGTSPQIIIDGDVDATFAYIPVHLEYILTEVLKNSFRATVERHLKPTESHTRVDIPAVYITIAPPTTSTADANGEKRPSFMTLRIRDEGGGVSQSNMAQIFSYSFTTAGRNSRNNNFNDDEDLEGGPYSAQHIGGAAAISGGNGSVFGEIAGRGVQTGMGTIAGLGYGLPMSRLYAKYFGGSLDFLSLDGWGSDVFLKLRCLDDAEPDVQIW